MRFHHKAGMKQVKNLQLGCTKIYFNLNTPSKPGTYWQDCAVSSMPTQEPLGLTEQPLNALYARGGESCLLYYLNI